jgi:hypothetical protein
MLKRVLFNEGLFALRLERFALWGAPLWLERHRGGFWPCAGFCSF